VEDIHINVGLVCIPAILMSIREQNTCSSTSLKAADTQELVHSLLFRRPAC
jgi:hypothetical protein